MKHISPNIEKSIKALYEKGESGHTLAKKFRIHYSTVYDCLKRNKIRIRSTKEAGILAVAKGRIAKHIITSPYHAMSPEKSYIFGVMCGDGYTHCTKNKSYQIALQAVDMDFVIEFADCLNKIYGIQPSISKIKARQTNWNEKWQARICCKEIFNDILNHGEFKTNSWRIPECVFESSNEIKCRFLRGFFDSEGSVDVNSKRITAVSTNTHGINDVSNLLKDLDIKSRIRKNSIKHGNRNACYSVRITGWQNVVRYCDRIGFSIERKQAKLQELTESYKLFMKTHEEAKKLLPEMTKLRNEGLSYEKIANKLGLGAATVWKYLKKKHKSRN
ncbi:MAG: LAGLIDADG family homing endonuclease [Candidatus Aenigmatarchaeota archaeon]